MSSQPLSVPRGALDPGLCPLAPCATGPAPLELHCWDSTGPSVQIIHLSCRLSCSWGHAAPSKGSHCLSCCLGCSRSYFQGPSGCIRQPFRELARGVWRALPRGTLPLLVIPGTWGLHCSSWDPARVPCERLSSRKIGKVPASPGLGFPVLGALAAWLQPSSSWGPRPLGCFCISLFFSVFLLL